jgi:hypothetical protein
VESRCCSSSIICYAISKIKFRTAISPVVEINFVHLLIPVHIAFYMLVRPEAFLIEILIGNALRLLGMWLSWVWLMHAVALCFLLL